MGLVTSTPCMTVRDVMDLVRMYPFTSSFVSHSGLDTNITKTGDTKVDLALVLSKEGNTNLLYTLLDEMGPCQLSRVMTDCTTDEWIVTYLVSRYKSGRLTDEEVYSSLELVAYGNRDTITNKFVIATMTRDNSDDLWSLFCEGRATLSDDVYRRVSEVADFTLLTTIASSDMWSDYAKGILCVTEDDDRFKYIVDTLKLSDTYEELCVDLIGECDLKYGGDVRKTRVLLTRLFDMFDIDAESLRQDEKMGVIFNEEV